MEFSNKDDAQQVMKILLKHVYRNPDQIKDGETEKLSNKEQRELRRLTTGLLKKKNKEEKSAKLENSTLKKQRLSRQKFKAGKLGVI